MNEDARGAFALAIPEHGTAWSPAGEDAVTLAYDDARGEAGQSSALGTRRLLVTGVDGFVGKAVARHVAADPRRRWSVIALSPTFDVCDAAATNELVARARPDAVIHLAAQSYVPESFADPERTLQVNVIGTLHLVEALRAAGFEGRLLYVGTGDVYGRVPEEELPVRETRLPQPRSPYAVSKLAAEMLCWQRHASEGLDVVLARPFNHIGAGQSPHFVVSDFARQIAAISLGEEPVIRVGDVGTTRDFTDVDDVVNAYFALLDRGTSGEVYNVCSGTERTIASILQELIAIAGIDVRIQHEPARMRQSEQRRMWGDATKLIAATGWRPRVPIRTSLTGALEHWQGILRNG